MLIKIEQFNGIAPRVAKHLLPNTSAQTAQNCRLSSGAIQPWADNLFVWTPTKVGTKQTIFLYEDQYWFHWLTDVNAVRSPIANDQYARVCFTGDGGPKMTEIGIVVQGGGTNYPNNTYNLGLPAPVAAPTVTPEAYSASATYALGYEITEGVTVYRCTTAITVPEAFTASKWEAVASTELESRAYVYTYVSAYGEEGPPCSASLIVTVGPSQHVALSSMSTAPTGSYNVTQKRIYRTNTGSSATEFQRVATIAVATTTYSDTTISAGLGEVLPADEWDAPPADLAGLTALPNGIMAGFSGQTICLSVSYQPHAWPVAWQIPVDYDIVGLGAFGTSLLVVTKGVPYVLTGTDPSSMTLEKMEVGHACVSKRGIVDMGYSIIYPAPEGLVVAGMGQFVLGTAKILTKKEWSAFSPSTISAYLYDGQYVGFYNGTAGFVFNPTTGDFTTLDFYATAGYSNPATGDLYLVVGGNIVKFDGSSAKTYTWKSKPFRASKPTNFAAMQVDADSYPVTAKVYADGVLKHTETVADGYPFRLPSGFVADEWEVELTGSAIVNTVVLASTMKELQQA